MIQNLLIAIEQCNMGLLHFNNGNIRAFLFGKKWYPLRAIINNAYNALGEEEVTTDRALVALSYLIPYTRIANIHFQDNFPIEINEGEILEELRFLNLRVGALL